MSFVHGLVIGKFYPPHAGHHHLIETAARACSAVTVVVAQSSAETIPLDLRLAWLREQHAATPHVDFAGVIDDIRIDYNDPDIWAAHCALFATALNGRAVDAVFSSEPYGTELARRFNATEICVDIDRRTFPVSGTSVRQDPIAHWDFLAPPVRGWLARRVVVLGAESTGTTRTALALAARFRRMGGVFARTNYVAEFGRELTVSKVEALPDGASIDDLIWTRDDFIHVAQTQNRMEAAAARSGSPILICDTDAFATAIWEERYLGSSSPQVRAARRAPDLYLLTLDEGVPFIDDGLRDGAHLRGWMTQRFREELAKSGVPWLELPGNYRHRLQKAVRACDALLAEGWRFAPPLKPS